MRRYDSVCMPTYDILLNDAMEAERLRNVARSIAASRSRRRIREGVADDVGALGLVLLGLVGTLVEKGVLTRDELLAHLRRVDELDGAADPRPRSPPYSQAGSSRR